MKQLCKAILPILAAVTVVAGTYEVASATWTVKPVVWVDQYNQNQVKNPAGVTLATGCTFERSSGPLLDTTTEGNYFTYYGFSARLNCTWHLTPASNPPRPGQILAQMQVQLACWQPNGAQVVVTGIPATPQAGAQCPNGTSSMNPAYWVTWKVWS